MEFILQFVFAVFVLLIIPGPDMAYCIAAGIAHGKKGAFFAAAGLGVGGLILTVVTACVVFLSVDLSTHVFALLQVFGSLYLLYLGLTILISSDVSDTKTKVRKKTASSNIFLRGVITNLSNPKALVFFISFIPQFIPVDAKSPHYLALILGMVLCVIGTSIDFLFGLSGVSFEKLTTQKIWKRPLSDCITALVFIFIAIIFLGNYIRNF